MASQFSSFNFMFLVVLFLISSTCEGQLSSTFYDTSCPDVLGTIKKSITSSISAEKRMAASLIRLHFHDCFVLGCDASILLDDTASFTGEQTAFPNRGTIRGLNVIAKAKTEVEKLCPGKVSCADILSVAARDASVAVGGPSWTVKLGRRDSLTASLSQANSNLPAPTTPLPDLISRFSGKGLSETDLVALSGAHTLGQSSCINFRARIYSNISVIDPGFASTRKRGCPPSGGGGDSNLAPLDLVTPNSFDNNYYKNIIQKKGLLASDQVLLSGGSTDSIVTSFSNTPATFSNAFAEAMVKMGDISPLTGSNGEIRLVCNAIN